MNKSVVSDGSSINAELLETLHALVAAQEKMHSTRQVIKTAVTVLGPRGKILVAALIAAGGVWAVWQLLKRLGIVSETLPGLEKPVPAAPTRPGGSGPDTPPHARSAPAPSPVLATRQPSTTLSTSTAPGQTVASPRSTAAVLPPDLSKPVLTKQVDTSSAQPAGPAPTIPASNSSPAVLPPDLPEPPAERQRKKKMRTKCRNGARSAKRQVLLKAEQVLDGCAAGPVLVLDLGSCSDTESVDMSPTWELSSIVETACGSEEERGELEEDDVFGDELAASGCPNCALVAELSGGRCCVCKDCADPGTGRT
ncbi:hypothetical protein GGF32_005119 [Allomyces javanicus]|nr:hypothetical protein GGF32_005119 [Allomyces javanicus]